MSVGSEVSTAWIWVCAWCGVTLPGNDASEISDESPLVTHGICPRCREEFMRSAAVQMDLLRSIHHPSNGVR